LPVVSIFCSIVDSLSHPLF
jgi:hypothetical protein